MTDRVIGEVVGKNGATPILSWDTENLKLGYRFNETEEWNWSPSLKGVPGTSIKGDPGISLFFNWLDTKLGIKKGEDGAYQYVDLKGAKGDQGYSIKYYWEGSVLNFKTENEANYTQVDLKGAKGETGSKSLIRGTVNNVDSLPSTGMLEGDCYFIKDIGDLYTYITNQWIKVGNLKGPIGTTLISIIPSDDLASITNPQQGILYIIPHAGGTNPNVYDEYFYITSSAQFEQIGQQEMDLSGYCLKTDYYTKTEIDNLIGTANDIITG
jgi:hypothetical protein